MKAFLPRARRVLAWTRSFTPASIGMDEDHPTARLSSAGTRPRRRRIPVVDGMSSERSARSLRAASAASSSSSAKRRSPGASRTVEIVVAVIPTSGRRRASTPSSSASARHAMNTQWSTGSIRRKCSAWSKSRKGSGSGEPHLPGRAERASAGSRTATRRRSSAVHPVAHQHRLDRVAVGAEERLDCAVRDAPRGDLVSGLASSSGPPGRSSSPVPGRAVRYPPQIGPPGAGAAIMESRTGRQVTDHSAREPARNCHSADARVPIAWTPGRRHPGWGCQTCDPEAGPPSARVRSRSARSMWRTVACAR